MDNVRLWQLNTCATDFSMTICVTTKSDLTAPTTIFDILVAVFRLVALFALSLTSSMALSFSESNGVRFEALFFEDTGKTTKFNELMTEDVQKRFQKPGENGLSFGWVNNPYWFKIEIKEYEKLEVLLLEIPWPLLDRLDIYVVNDSQQAIVTHNLGDHKVFSKRLFFDANFVIPIDFKSHRIQTIFINIDTTSSLQLPLKFSTQHEYLKNRTIYYTVQGIFYGLLLVMIFYNLFIYFSTKRIAYLHYIFFVISFGTLQAGLKGAGFQFIWPNSVNLNDFAIATSGGFSLLFLTLFARSFLQLNEAPTLKKINNYMLAVALIFIVASFFLEYRTIITPLTIVVLISSLIVITKAIYRYRQGFREARYYLMAWVAMVIGCFIYLFKQLGLLPVNFFTENAMQIGSAMEILLLSLALADRLNTLRVGLESANLRLEKDVANRTQELVSALDKLGKANSKLAVISITDGLTGLRNRYHFDISLDKEIERIKRNQTTVSLLLLDIDRFKNINDQWGHLSGDNALEFVSQLFKIDCKRPTDIICRYGGEEFAIILPETQLEAASALADRIRHRVEYCDFFEGEIKIPITISVGVSSSNAIKSLDSKLLVRAADIALYNAKEDGRNCVHIFKGNLSKNAAESFEKTQRFFPQTTKETVTPIAKV